MFRLDPILDNNFDPPHIDGFEVFLDDECIGIFWTCEEEAIGMLDKIQNKPSKFTTKLELESLSKENHHWLKGRGECCHILYGELFVDNDTALNILGKLNE